MRVGDVLDGRYELVERLGQGGFGVVWRAFDTRMRRQVAVKVIGHHGEDQQKAALRFVREACAAGNLSHPHIVTVHDLGEGELAGRQVTFLVMELLTGRTLTAVLRAGLPDPVRSLTWGRQICDALAAAHDAGMVHRDIKPDNIMVTGAGVVKVLDFGIAQLDTGAGGLTTTGTVIGSPAYMAPERWTGGRVDGRADLYAFGCVLVELCTGARPFAGDSTPVLMYQHLNEPPPALDPAQFGLPAEVAGLVAELLAKDPADRPADARAVERRLAVLAERYAAQAPEAGPAGPVPTATVLDRPGPAVAPPVVPPPAEPPVAVPMPAPVPLPPQSGPSVPAVPSSVPAAPSSVPSSVPVPPAGPPAPAAPPPAGPVLPPLTTPPVTAPPAAADAVRAALRERRSAAFRAATAGESAAALQSVAQDAVLALGATDRDTLATWRDFTWYLSRAGDLDGAIRLLTAVVEDMRLALGPADPDTLSARYHLTWCIGESGETVTAVRQLTQLLPDLHAVWGGHDARVLKARHDLAVYAANRGDLDGAVLQLRTLLPDLARSLGEQHPTTVQAWHDLAGYQQRLAQPARRSRTVRRARIGREEAVVLVRRLLAWDFASDQEANACLNALERGTGIKGVGDWILSAPDHVTAEDLVEELLNP
ncbi:serine/threonine-protein kinase [Kitasatospora sp. CM 4170]|uniref:serine/threonine-protein kinase n=1 Tax=Kitasatospora TaxID=2063 RepID=UPI0028B1CF4E|nr:serine/threonine-protein kinase [Kitasatospora sp. CM 4170]WNM47677.1 serine/threonine-protein kinase [Kitasatospora sp. CM 4170]